MKDKYTPRIKLDNSVRIYSVIDDSTGEITVVESGMPKFIGYPIDFTFIKFFDSSIRVLMKNLTPNEYMLCMFFVRLASGRNNSLAPYNDLTPYTRIEDGLKDFSDGKQVLTSKTIKLMILKFKEIGILKMDDAMGYWVLNPYVACKSKVMIKRIKDMFVQDDITQDILRDYRLKSKNTFVWKDLDR